MRVGFKTFGCRSNHADTIDLQAALVEKGSTPANENPDVIVVNTCSVTDQADNEAYRYIRRTKKENPNSRIVVTGCLAELETKKLADLKDVDAVIGPGRKSEVLKAIYNEIEEKAPFMPKKYRDSRQSISLNDSISSAIASPGEYLGEVKQRARYHLRIQEGCENSCTFCIIPHTRGHLSSRPQELILEDVKALVNAGYKEIVITGTHIGGYGEDCGSSLFELLKSIIKLRDTKKLDLRVRLSSIDPNDLHPELLELYVNNQDFFCSHLHICVQSFCDKTLKRMNRRYKLAEIDNIVHYINDKVPRLCLGTDIITGFPGESRQELDQGVEEFLRLPFSYIHVFPYSERSGTAATRLDGSIEVAERKRRAARWRSIGERKKKNFYNSLKDNTLEVVLERLDSNVELDGKSGVVLYGTSREYVATKILCPQISKLENSELGALKLGQYVKVKAVKYDEGKLLCHLLSQEN